MKAPIDMSVCNGYGCDKNMFCKRFVGNYEVDESAKWYVSPSECIEDDHIMLIKFSMQDNYDRVNRAIAARDLL